MSKKVVMSVFDSAVGEYLTPFFARSVAEARRQFEVAAVKEGHDFQLFGADFHLVELGQWDSDTAGFTALEAPRRVCSALEAAASAPDRRQGDLVLNPDS